MRIVVVEDEIRIREGLCKLLEKTSSSYNVVGQAENGKDGLALILGKNPDLIITDVRMPVMDGIEMLKSLQEHRMQKKTIILSAYSEFAYAQQAIALGVVEYLIKPITVDALTTVLRRVEHILEYEKRKNPASLGSLEHILGSILYGGLIPDNYLSDYLEEKYHIDNDTIFSQVYFRLDQKDEVNKERIKNQVVSIVQSINKLASRIVIPHNPQDILIVIYGFDAEQKLVDVLAQSIRLLKKDNVSLCMSIGWSRGVSSLKPKYRDISESMEWGIVLGDNVVIDNEKLKSLCTVPCVYPIQMENDIRIAICANEPRKIDQIKDRFIAYFRNKNFTPKGIKESYVRFIWAIINVSKEISLIDYDLLDTQNILENITNAVSYSELIRELNALIGKIKASPNSEQKTTSLTVNRAKSMIHEFYQSGITLEEIAEKLNITPEYLGTLFREKIGLNFTAYIKEYRMTKAKELLLGTKMKLYEIAQGVGYSDPKYFSRVFKECTGQLPAEYRRINK